MKSCLTLLCVTCLLGAAEVVPLEEVDPTMVRRQPMVVMQSEQLPAIQEAPLAVPRGLPQTYHDQATATLRGTHPELQVLVDRRSGQLGQAQYSLLAYRSAPTGSAHQLTACVLRGNRAWRLELAIDDQRFDIALLLMLQRINQLGHGG
jgi:hypothetical protein